MAVANHGFNDGAERALLEQVEGLGVARVPTGLEIDQDMDMAALRGGLDGERVGVGEGEWLLHEHMDAQRRALLNHLPMFAGRGEDQCNLRMSLRGHLRDRAEIKRAAQMEFFGVGVEELLISLDDAHQLDIRTVENSSRRRERAGLEEALDVTVDQADNRDFERSRGGRGREGRRKKYEDECRERGSH